MDLMLKTIESEAYRKSEALRGQADAEAVAIYAQSVGNNPELFAYLKTLDVYRNSLKGKTNFVMSSNNRFLDMLSQGGR